MKFKKGVIINGNDETPYMLQLEYKKCKVADSDMYLVEALRKSVVSKEKLLKMIMDKEHIDSTAASFGLGQFIIDYSEYLEDEKKHYKIED